MTNNNYSERKQKAFDLSKQYWITGRGERFEAWGIPFVMGRREGYRLFDIDGHEVIDAHLNGGTYNLGHRNSDVLKAMMEALGHLDMGNHHFPSEERGLFAKALVEAAPGNMSNAVMVNSGSEAIDLAVRTARNTKGKRKIISLDVAYHGYGSIVPSQMGAARSAKYFLSEASKEEVDTIKWNDLVDAEEKLSKGDVAGLLVEVSPATSGFLMPAPGYIKGLKNLCEKYDVAYIADEVQVGMGRTGKLWAVENFDVEPDILCTAKALGGGLVPLGAVIMREPYAKWLEENPWLFTSTSGGNEIGCHIGRKTLEITQSPETKARVNALIDIFTQGLADIASREPFLKGVRQMGLIIALETDAPQGAIFLMEELYKNGVWAIVSGLDESVLQFKPGLLLDDSTAFTMLERLEKSLKAAKVKALTTTAVNMM